MNDIENKKLFRAEEDVLKNWIENAIEALSDREFIQIVVRGVLPQVEDSEHYNRLYLKWLKDREAYIYEKQQLEEVSPLELEQTFVHLKEELAAQCLLKNPIIMQQIYSINQVFHKKEEHNGTHYSHIDIVSTHIEELLLILLGIGMDEIVAVYGKIKVGHFPMRNVFTGRLDSKYIEEFTFAPSLRKKRKLERIFYSNNIEKVWVALELLFLLKKYWNMSRDQVMAGDHQYWGELDALRMDDKYVLSFFNREKIISCCRVIVREMFYENNSIARVSGDDLINSLLKLDLVEKQGHYRLILRINNLDKSNFFPYCVHVFREESSPLQITINLFKGVEKQIDIIKASSSDGVRTAAKYFERTGLNNVLGEIFFDQDGSLITLKKQVVSYKSLSKHEREKIKHLLSKLKVFEHSY